MDPLLRLFFRKAGIPFRKNRIKALRSSGPINEVK
jgi:hypothetical protein